MKDESAIRTLLDSYVQAWRRNDAEAIASHWSPSQFRFYKAEEIDHFLIEWAQVRAYLAHNESFNELVELRFPSIQLVATDGATRIGILRLRWDIRFSRHAQLPDGAAFAHRGKTMGGDNHVLALFEPTAEGYKLTGWSETPDAPISYVARLYQKDVRPDFGAG